jgi:hypothetical protein
MKANQPVLMLRYQASVAASVFARLGSLIADPWLFVARAARCAATELGMSSVSSWLRRPLLVAGQASNLYSDASRMRRLMPAARLDA